MPAIAMSAGAERKTRCERILGWINDQKPTDVGRYTGWGTGEELKEPEGGPERIGPAMMPFLRHRATDRWWRVAFGLAWIPATIVLITIEDWMHVPQGAMWISIGALFVAFTGLSLVLTRVR